MSNRFCLKLLAAAISMAAAGSVCATPVSSYNNLVNNSQSFVALTSHATLLRAGDKVVGPLAVSQPMHVTVSLNLRNKTQLDVFVANPKHANLTSAQFNAMFAPTLADAQAVASYLTKSGFNNVSIAPNRQLVTATARADTAAAAFHTNFVHVKTHDGRDAFATGSSVQIPTSLQGKVLEVLGLQTVHIFHVLKPTHINASSGTAGAHKPTDFAAIYNASSSATGKTINVGVITVGDMTNVKSDFSKFLGQNPSLGSIPLNVVKVDGAGTTTGSDSEWDLDTQDIAGISGGVKALYLYDTSGFTDQGLVDDFNAAVTANVVQVINVSIGGCETGSETGGVATGDNVFEQAVAQGQTFSISTGDIGADECSNGGIVPSWPADSQYVVAVGGTELYTSGTTWTSETVWNNLSSNEGATGGSPSTFEAQPSWQKNVGKNSGSKYRGLPDVAFDASPVSGVTIIVDGANEQWGGTSLASPLFVGVWARALAAKSSLGFAAPVIYADAVTNYATDFHDVTSGNNDGETAATGWDYTTGFGSINVANFISHVAGGSNPPPAGPIANFTDSVNGLAVSFTNSSTDAGGTITGYSWNFGDSSTSTSASPSHTYAAAGTYTVTLKVTDSNNNTSTKTGSVTVTNPTPPPAKPVANFTDSVNGLVVSFTNSSTDTGGTITGYSWNFGDSSTSTSASPSHTYTAAGTYTVTLTVTDSNNNSSTKSESVTAVLTPPTAAASLSVPASNDLSEYTVSWTSVSRASSYTLEQQFGNGAWTVVQNAAATSWPSNVSADGTYNYRVEACNTSGCGPWSNTGTIVVQFAVTEPPPSTAPVLNVPATSNTGNYTITWGSVRGGSTYNLYVQVNGGLQRSVGHPLSNTLVVKGKANGTYSYQVQACNVIGCGPLSPVSSIVVDTP